MNGSPLKLILLLVGIFLAGAVAGGFVTVEYVQAKLRERGQPEQWGPARLKLLEKRLELTEEQKEKLKPIIKRDVEELNKLRQSGFNETRRILQRMEADIAAVLTPEQKVKFDKVNEEMRERIRKQWEQRRGERRDGRPPGAPGEGKDGPPPPPPDGKKP